MSATTIEYSSNALIERQKKLSKKIGRKKSITSFGYALKKLVSENYKHGDISLIAKKYKISKPIVSKAKNNYAGTRRLTDAFQDFYTVKPIK